MCGGPNRSLVFWAVQGQLSSSTDESCDITSSAPKNNQSRNKGTPNSGIFMGELVSGGKQSTFGASVDSPGAWPAKANARRSSPCFGTTPCWPPLHSASGLNKWFCFVFAQFGPLRGLVCFTIPPICFRGLAHLRHLHPMSIPHFPHLRLQSHPFSKGIGSFVEEKDP